jgi:lipopolysaccharide export system ATP-binding protein
MLSARHLRKTYGAHVVVDDVSIDVEAGQIVGLLGPNGAGKTTTFRMLTGVERPDRGEVLLDGRDLAGLPLAARARAGLGYLPQEETLLTDLSVYDNVAIAVDLSRSGADPVALLDQAGIGGLRGRAVTGLSGGERRRLAVARILAIRPKVLLLDEPFAGVDPIAVAGLQALVREIAASGVGVLITDHAVRETLAVCAQAVLIDAGVVHVRGTPAEVAADAHARARYLGPDFVL